MPKRSITDTEIGLIKAMLKRSTKNRDIQFHFNRPDRPVNSGRITGIKDGTYGAAVPEASSAELNRFLSAQDGIQDNATRLSDTLSKLKKDAANRFRSQGGRFFCYDGETQHQEAKLEFPWPKFNQIIRTVAGLANRDGGFVFFGVSDGEFEAKGLCEDTFEKTDISNIVHKLKTHLMPVPDIYKFVLPVGGKIIGVLYVCECDSPPVVVFRDGDKLTEGDILYRYPGETTRIRYGELSTLLRKRDRLSQIRLAKVATEIAEVGSEQSIVLSASEQDQKPGTPSITIDESLLRKIKFIREGRLSHVEGSPTLRLVGDVQPVGSETSEGRPFAYKAMSARDTLVAFLLQEAVPEPLEYVYASALLQRQWLPLFYFVDKSNFSLTTVIERLEKVDAQYRVSKQAALDRLRGVKSAFSQPTGNAIAQLELLIEGKHVDVTNRDDVSAISRAYWALPSGFKSDKNHLRTLLSLLDHAQDDSAKLSHVFRAAARLDELKHGAQSTN